MSDEHHVYLHLTKVTEIEKSVQLFLLVEMFDQVFCSPLTHLMFNLNRKVLYPVKFGGHARLNIWQWTWDKLTIITTMIIKLEMYFVDKMFTSDF